MKQIAIIGYGAIAALHAAKLRAFSNVTVGSVFGPDPEKAVAFAKSHDIRRSANDLGEALKGMDAAVICSPSEHHVSQAQVALERVPAVLVELPACGSASEAETLAEAAARRNARLHCAHTSRYLEPYRRVDRWLKDDQIGFVSQVRYARSIPARAKSWVDDALVHHASHPLDLLLAWFGDLLPRSGVVLPIDGPPHDVSLLAALRNGAPVSVSISYRSHLPVASTTLIGSKHTVETDGFSYIQSDREDFNGKWDAQIEYEAAIAEQDHAFLAGEGVPWPETIRLASLVDEFRKLAGNQVQ